MSYSVRALPIAASLLAALVVASMLGVATAHASDALAPASAGSVSVQAASSSGSSSSAKATSKKTGWKKTKAGKVYYRAGKKVTGLQKIGKKRYYFTSKGILKTTDVKVGKYRYYVDSKGVLIGAKVGDTCYYNTLKRMTSADAYDFETFLQARSIVKSITGKSDSKEQKLHKAFDWVMGKYYGIHRTFNPFQTNWPAIYARDHFDNLDGDCHADGAAFAYLAAAIGYPADVCLDAVSVGSSHCWAMIGNKVYDPLFAQSKSYAGYYGATSGTYEVSPTARYRVPQFDPSHAGANAKASKELTSGGAAKLKKSGKYYYCYQNGKKVKNAWKTIKGKRYYFTKNGRAATYSAKVKGAYYVFSEKGVLQKSSKSGKRIVKVGKFTYQVKKSGKAASGWSADKTRRFDKTGLLMTGVNVAGKEFYAASADGTYDASLTAQLNDAAQAGKPAVALRKLLGEPKSAVYAASCNFAGDDGLWTYDGFIVATALPSGAAKATSEAAAAYEPGTQPDEPFESVASIEAS